MRAYVREFGKHVRMLRRNRGLTQEVLAERSNLSADTIRRIESGSFSASILTLRKLCVGLGVSMSTLFESFEVGRVNERRELVDLLASCGPKELGFIIRVVRSLIDELQRLASDVG